MEPDLQLPWVKRGECFYSSQSGYYDLFRSAWSGEWVVIDWGHGNRFRGTPAECERWVKSRAKQTAEATK